MFVPVVDDNHRPLMPTTPARARRWIKTGKATAFWKGGLFCVRLNHEPSARESQPVAVGIDPGSRREGYSVVSAAHTYLNIQAEARTGVKEAEEASTRMRRTRRRRKTLKRLAPLRLMQGDETKVLREQWGRKKSSTKLAETFEAHCVDAFVLARSAVAGTTAPDNRQVVCIAPFLWHRRQLHRFQPEPGGKRKPYSGTFPQGIKRGTLLVHPRWGKATVDGTMHGRLSLHDSSTNKRLRQTANVSDGKRHKLLRWRTRLIPLHPRPQKGGRSHPLDESRGVPNVEFL